MNMDNGEVQEMNKSHMNFSYRNSYLKEEKKYFIVSAIFDLNHKIEKYHSDIDNIDFRQNKQPK
jgi:UDP-N-acetylenolpyruvoylglucosamine reductase